MPAWIQGLLRHGLTMLGGVLIAKGLATDGQVNEIIGAVVTVAGIIWSLIDKKTRA